jgi:phospholipase A1
MYQDLIKRVQQRLQIYALVGACVVVMTGCATSPTVQPAEPIETMSAEPTFTAITVADGEGVLVNSQEVDDYTVYVPVHSDAQSAVGKRVREERRVASNPYVIAAHKHNYILPASYSSRVNEQIYEQNEVRLREGLQPTEVKFQISLKNQLNEKDLLLPGDALSLGITMTAWWQLYSDDLSSPFRETNYQPEVFYLVPLRWGPYSGTTAVVFGLEHQSNGQVQGLSRSWNRLYSAFIYEKGPMIAMFRPWYRIPEKAKASPDEAEGDDNPDIHRFLGYADVSVSWRHRSVEYAIHGRGNPSTGKGSVELGLTFPLFSRFRGFVQYFNGYGDSLIDYNHFQQRIGVGVALTSLY